MSELTPGRIVHYVVTEADRAHVDALRSQGLQANPLSPQQHLPAVVVQGWSPVTANLQVWLDGAGCLWKTSITQGTVPGTWHWPERDDAPPSYAIEDGVLTS